MDFIDILVKFEEENNSRIMTLIEELRGLDDLDGCDMFVIDEFIDLEDLEDGEVETTIGMLDTIDMWKDRELAAGTLLSLYKFYYNSFGLETALLSMHHTIGCDCFRISIESDHVLARNYEKAMNMYSHFGDSSELGELYEEPPSGKIFFIYRDKIIVVYYVEKDEESN